MKRLASALLVLLLFHCTSALAIDFGSGALPIAHEPDKAFALPSQDRLEIAGHIDPGAPVTLVLRIDDGKSTGYNSRMNDERTLAPGPFSFSLDIANLKSTDGRQLDVSDIRRVILFIHGNGSGHVNRFATSAATSPANSQAVPNSNSGSAPPSNAEQTSSRRKFGLGQLPIKFDPGAPVAFSDADEIRIEGTVKGAAPAAVALRVDDKNSRNYATRFNDERMIPPGPFSISVGLKGLKTSSGRTLDASAITQIILFAWQGTPQIEIARFETQPAATLPADARGFSFGALDAAIPPGFERIGPSDQKLTGRGTIEAVRRPAPDPLVANGLKNVRRIVLPAGDAARVRVTVWSEDPGEWELLPHPFERRIQVNGRELLNEKWAADDWIVKRYLRGAKAEHAAADDAWTAYGNKRGNPHSIDVDTDRKNVTIDISGAENSAYFISAVLIEPAIAPATPLKQSPGQAFVDEQRAAWYRSKFPVAPAPADEDDDAQSMKLLWNEAQRSTPIVLRARAAPETGFALKLSVVTDKPIARPSVKLTSPRRGNAALDAKVWGAQYRLERDDTVLRLRADRLLADTASLPIETSRPRRYEVWIDVPKGAAPGTYTGAISFAGEGRAWSFPIEVDVAPVRLPEPAKPAGFYLARAAHLSFFPGLTIERERQVQCDLDYLRSLGLTNTAPPITGLDRNDLGLFASDMRRAQSSGIAPGWLIYNPLTDLASSQGLARAADTVARLEDLIKAQNIPRPLWSVADEPSNPDQSAEQLTEWVRLLRQKSPGVRLAGHLNAPTDRKFVPLFDTLIVNQAFGIDATNLERIRKGGKSVWIYNTFAHRQTAGLWLWWTAAERYIQWHARLPTADPFDPTDGREADFQMLYPSTEICPRQPDIHRHLLRMAEGIVDQRWLLWLDEQSSPAARRVREEIRSNITGEFEAAQRMKSGELDKIRERIMDLAFK